MFSFIPRLPQELTRVAFSIRCRGTAQLRVEIEPKHATYTLVRGDPLKIRHHGRALTVTTDKSQRRAIPPAPALERPTQPPGREPARRRVAEQQQKR
jgi:alpha,alpha-trehalose phosphorylase